ncbi:MAG: uridylate kinase [Methanotrichaceae archaeon]|nr:uridylate kinase [Methanotrichaceae archaeon]
MPFYVLKLGGSLIDVARDMVRSLLSLTAEGYSFLVVPGGGPMADLIRDLFSRYGISQEAAHWMAVLAMEQYAYFLADGTGAKLTRKIQRPEGLEILLPYQALLEDDSGLCHSWEYTSDSIAALAALRLDAPLIKATDVDGVMMDGLVVREVKASVLLGRETCIDQGTLHLLKGRSCRVICGLDPARFISSLRNGEGGTVIKG